MGPTFADFASARGPLMWLLGLCAASVMAFAVAKAAPPPPPTTSHSLVQYKEYKQYKRVGRCIGGKWVYR